MGRLVEVMSALRERCPWDAEQTHRSLVSYLIEETYETVEAIESGDQADLREELGDLLLQVIFHAQIASERADGFGIADVAAGIADKLIRRHPYVFDDDSVPDDLNRTWEQRKAIEKGRRSALEGIPPDMSPLARASKIISRARSHQVTLDLPDADVDGVTVGDGIVGLVARAQVHGIDAEQAVRDAVRDLEERVVHAEAAADTRPVGA